MWIAFATLQAAWSGNFGRISAYSRNDGYRMAAYQLGAAGSKLLLLARLKFQLLSLIELHTDHLEAHYVPRPKVFWDPIAAVVSYDGQLATSGITTVLDSLRVWREDGAEDVDGRAGILAAAITAARESNILRADHFL